MIVTPAEMRAIEEAAFAHGSTAEALMDTVGTRIAVHLSHLIGQRTAVVLFYAGKGNNAGDVLVAAAKLAEMTAANGANVQMGLRLATDNPAGLGELPRRKLATIPTGRVIRCTGKEAQEISRSAGKVLIVDGLLGIGAKGPLRDPVKGLATEVNALRRLDGAYVLSVDVPSGIDAETGHADRDAIIADETLAVGFAKTGLVADEATNHVGKLEVIALPEFMNMGEAAPEAGARGAVVTAADLRPLLPPRPHESNKGMYGRVAILAGSVGATGAAIMCAHACARAGAGLITLLTHPDIYPIVAAAASPEVMVKPFPNLLDVLDMDFDILGLGPGLGRQHDADVCTLILRWPKPMVVDADGLNALAENMETLARPAGPRLLTPHPGEMKRLLLGSADLRPLAGDKRKSRPDIVRLFTDRYPVTLLLKGTRTIVAEKRHPLAYNTTGNAGMATGGMGDVLTGICCALAGQKLTLYDAARCGAWLHGRAADLARAAGESEQSLLPLDLLALLGRAFSSIRHDAC